MDRRGFLLTAIAGASSAPRLASAQPSRRVYRLGVLGLASTADLSGPRPKSLSAAALLLGLRELGYVYGRDFMTEGRGVAGRPERFHTLAAELVGLKVDAIVATGVALPALKQATSQIPVVMAATLDPVSQGFAESLSRPGGNVTGLSLQSVETTGKRLELLKELVPRAAPVAVIWNQLSILNLKSAEATARERGWQLLPLEIHDIRDVQPAFKSAAETRAGSVLVFAAGILFPHARLVAELAAKTRIPAMYELRAYVDAGGLIAYGADINDIWRRSALFVDKIFRGAKPADLPIEQPSKFELVINRTTAKALGLTIPPSLLARADQVIE